MPGMEMNDRQRMDHSKIEALNKKDEVPMKSIQALWIAGLLMTLAFAGCAGDQEVAPAGKQYPVKGKVIAVDPSQSSVKLDHEEIPGLMPAMEMDYSVENARLLEGVEAGDQVQGQLKAESGKYVITRLEKR